MAYMMLERKQPLIGMELVKHQREIKGVHMGDLFKRDHQRFSRFTIQFGDILFDCSKNRVTEQTMQLFLDLAGQADLSKGKFR